ncbi:MAG TPA: HAD hydrolase-like protein [Longimicrobiaceae bacterium]|nr:HAD hydrolase-like protein [Longimicrobiaceae bacterium]
MRRLVLFDIDGTLLHSGGAGARALRDALVEVFGTAGPVDRYSMAGRTDPQIARELLRAAGLDAARIDAGLPALWRAYVRNLEREVRESDVRVLPGVLPLLERVEAAGNGTVLGLLTGNVVEGARLKLESAGIGFGRFRVGAYGSDHADRPELPAVAVARAEALTGYRFREKEVVIIGDTPFDIACGEHLGVRTVAVATGHYSADDLAKCGPDHLFDDLTETERVWEAIAEG